VAKDASLELSIARKRSRSCGICSREGQLYELVWAGPITTLAKSLAVSDVELAKACRRGDIPLAPRGYLGQD
jgi:hypothetical protein